MQERLMPSSEAFSLSPLLSEGTSPFVKTPLIEYGFIPRPHERVSTEQARHTAGHELNHALIAIDYGVMPVSLSVIPEGNSLGRTVFSGEINTETFKVIAGGGSVDTAFGRASGFGSAYQLGSDLHHIESLRVKHGGIDATEAVRRASESLGRIPEKVRERASEIIASLGRISGNEILKIIRIAELEVHHGILSASPKLEASVRKLQASQTYIEAVSSDKRTIIGIDGNGVVEKPILVGKDKVICPRCGQETAHLPTCFYDKNENVLKKNSEFPSSGTIVDLRKELPIVA